MRRRKINQKVRNKQIARRLYIAKSEDKPGVMDQKMRRRMGDVLADIFDEYGLEIYNNVILALKETLDEKFREGIGGLNDEITQELGKQGLNASQEFVHGWMQFLVDQITHYGMDEASTALEDLASSLAAEYSSEEADSGEAEEADVDLTAFDLDVDSEEPAEEEEETEAEEDKGDEDEGEDLNLEELEQKLAAFLGRHEVQPKKRRMRRQAAEQVESSIGVDTSGEEIVVVGPDAVDLQKFNETDDEDFYYLRRQAPGAEIVGVVTTDKGTEGMDAANIVRISLQSDEFEGYVVKSHGKVRIARATKRKVSTPRRRR